MKNKKIKILSALITAVIVITSCMSVFAGSMLEYNGSLYSLVLKSEKDFSDGSFLGYDNGKGTVGIGIVDDEHGNSVVLTASGVEDYGAAEGPWTQFDGDKSLPVSVYELDVYVDQLTNGAVKFSSRGTGLGWSLNMIDINTDGIGLYGSDNRIPFELGVWHKLRFLFDCGSTIYFVYVDDMETAAFSGTLSTQMTKGIQFMRMVLMAQDAYAAADNFRNYSLLKMPEGYETPRLTLRPLEEKITESKSTQIEAVIETDAEIENVNFYVNDELIYTDAEAPYILEHLFEQGDYTVRAEATDIYGETGESEIAITSLADTRPRIEIGLESGKEYDRATLTDVLVSVTMSEAELAEGKVFVDGEKIASLTKGDNTIDMSGLSVGRHKIEVYAENSLGESAERLVQITVARTFDNVVWSADFNDGTKFGQINASGQFIRPEVIRQDFKESLLVGANTTQDTSKEGAWIPASLKNTNTTAVLDFDIYFSSINGNGMKTRLNYLETYKPELFSITTKGISAGSASTPYPFEEKRWYHITLEVNSQNASYSVSLDGEPIFTNVAIVNMPKGVAMDSVRIISMLQGTEETYYAIDNIVVRQITQAPSIVNITSKNGDTNIVSARDREINVYFSGALEATSVYASKFTLSGAVIKKAVYDAENHCVTLTLEKPLSAGVYRLTAAENLVMSNGEIYAEKLYGDFEVKNSVFEVLSSVVNENRITASIMNSSPEDKTVYMIINLYNGEMLKSRAADELTLVSGENNLSKLINGYASGDKAEVFIWDSLLTPVCIMSISN